MSRVGKQPITVPDKVEVDIGADTIAVKGPKGSLQRKLHPLVSIKLDGKVLKCERVDDSREARCLHGLYRALIANMVNGVHEGFTKVLELVGVGYRAELKGQSLVLSLGFSHPVEVALPQGITALVDKQTKISLSGANNELLGEVAASIRKLRPPEPYKGKGVRYSGEHILRKAGKAASGGK